MNSDTFEDLASLILDSAQYGTPTGLDFANVNGSLRMLVGTKNAPGDWGAKNNFVLDIDANGGSIDQYVKITGDFNKLEDLSYDVVNMRLTTAYDSGSSGLVESGDFQAFDPYQSWLNQYGIYAEGDADGDGLSNENEYLAGTNPTNSNSSLKLNLNVNPSSNQFATNRSLQAENTNSMYLEFNSVLGRTYVIESCTELGGEWNSFYSEIEGTGSKVSVPIDIEKTESSYYRVVIPTN